MADLLLFAEVPERVLAVYAHPDDADVACGATLARWADAGSEVHLVLLADGGKGTSDPAVEPADLAATRALEVAAAVDVLGLSSVEILGIADGEVPEQLDLIETLVQRIRNLRPSCVLGHDPTAVFFGSVYVNHRDHRAAGWALLDAVSPSAAQPHYFPDSGPSHRVNDVLLSGTLEADTYVDVSSTIDRKVDAVTAHGSQLPGDHEWIRSSVRQRAAEVGRAAGVAFAEGFRHLVLDT
jgi:LmbE family N-acetylglucosaminyl deacetylase